MPAAGTCTEKEIREKRAFEWAFGKNTDGELSLGVTKNALVPAYAIGLKDISTRQIACSSRHTILISSQGSLFTSGSKLHGKLGKNADTRALTKFKHLSKLSQHKVRQIACNDYTTLCLLEDASVLQLGGSSNHEPRVIPALAGM